MLDVAIATAEAFIAQKREIWAGDIGEQCAVADSFGTTTQG